MQLGQAGWLWVEVKQIWKPGAAHWLWEDAVRDITKLKTLRPPEARQVGLLLIGIDGVKREQYHLKGDIEGNGRFAERNKLGSWQREVHTFKPHDDRRVNAWFWLRDAD